MNAETEKILYQRAKIAQNLDKILSSTKKSISSQGQLSLFTEETTTIDISLDEPENFNPIEIAEKERDAIGFNLSYSPFDEFETIRIRYCNSDILDSLVSKPRERKTLLAKIKSIEYKTSQFGNSYAKIVFSDDRGEERFYLFGDLYKNKIKDCFINRIYLLTVEMNDDQSRLNIVNFMSAKDIDLKDKCKCLYVETTSNKLPELRLYLKCFMAGDKQDVFVKITDLNGMIIPSICRVAVDNENLLEMKNSGFKLKLR